MSAVAGARAIYLSPYVLAVATVTVSRMAARGARNTSAIVAATVHGKAKRGRLGKSRLMASATFFDAALKHERTTGMSKDSLFALLRIDRFFQALDLCSHPFELSEVSLDFVSTVLQRGQLV